MAQPAGSVLRSFARPDSIASAPGRRRRTPAHLSVSLKHPPLRTELGLDQAQAGPLSASLANGNNCNHSGESSNPEQWFEMSNNLRQKKPSFNDHEPPFFLQNPSTESGGDSQIRGDTPPAFQSQSDLLLRLDSNENISEEYRSVIDDLTIENKCLKGRLRKLEGLHDKPMQSQRLFEVRVHGLPAVKKMELNEMLKKFAINLNKPPTKPETNSAPLALHVEANIPKPTSSHTSTRVADSGYGSMAASNHASSNQMSNAGSSSRTNHANQVVEASRAREQNIHSYLHDIPEGLLPRQSRFLSAEARKQHVVSRLEQIFGGRGAAVEGHQQPIQQQEISQVAAKDDRSAIEARGQRAADEGTREAPIMPRETEDPMEPTSAAYAQSEPNANSDSVAPGSQHRSEETNTDQYSTCFEQRPTRPLDLDPQRAQVPAENIGYFRHLGFSLPDGESGRKTADSEGWVYLNLLTNMAQLHTINVTTDFVKQAIVEQSEKLELSRDGRKVRWKDSERNTRNDSNQGSATCSSNQDAGYSPNEHFFCQTNPRKRARTSQDESYVDLQRLSNNAQKRQELTGPTPTAYLYRPMLPRNESDEDVQISDYEYGPDSQYAEDYFRASSDDAFKSNRKSSWNRCGNGSMMFYSNANFYLDLTGDKPKASKTSALASSGVLAQPPLGSQLPSATENAVPKYMCQSDSLSTIAQTETAEMGSVSKKRSHQSSSKSIHVGSPSVEEAQVCEKKACQSPLKMDVSGIGGVYPADNFSIDVRRTVQTVPQPSVHQRQPWMNKCGIGSARKHEVTSQENVVSTEMKQLPPSSLPDASFAFSPKKSDSTPSSSASPPNDLYRQRSLPYIEAESSESGSDDDYDSESNDPEITSMASEVQSQLAHIRSNSGSSTRPFPNHQATQVTVAASLNQNEEDYEEEEDYDEEDDDNQSVDFLAAARQADPEAILRREREYDAEMAERLAEEIPAGSSAATCGGGKGSGQNSPADVYAEMDVDQGARDPNGSDEEGINGDSMAASVSS
ncbi:MAG: hypothetical protein M1831_005691 [Alyxoria varia]|nr:MAG: hypothetical protein M1831_005691 [Alyxoria varia]